MIVEGYTQFGATERTAGALRNILDHLGVIAPHSGEPFTEALLMGIGGGLGAEYATWAFKGIDPSRPPKSQLYLRYHHVKNYIEKKEETFLRKIATRIGTPLTVKETTSRERADQFLHQSLQAGNPVMVQLSIWHSIYSRQEVNDRYHNNCKFYPPLLYDEYVSFLPYYSLPYPWITGHFAILYGIDEDSNQVYLTDYSNRPHTLSLHQFTDSRSIIKGWKNAAYTITVPQTKPNLVKAIRLGIHDSTESLLHEKTVISGAHLRVEAWKAMATMIGDFDGKRGWLALFKEPWQLYDTLTRLHAQIAFHNSDSGALRSSYADFLEEASNILKKPTLKQIAHQFSEIGIMWDEIGTTALNDNIPELLSTRKAALKWHNTFKVQGSAASQSLDNLSKKIQGIRSTFTKELPLTQRELLTLLEELSIRFHEVYEAEKAALQALHTIMK
ncbi:MAG: BtrH N-terminal domain-containing protein [Promethearchaeota archaeon]